ncbi:TetR/AcrR family transcriptional regulator [Microbacterium sp. DT81.1]|uniref:TetR/AcrR family transcriptional regulator n=1 Tax=Microbacterium sp. DT81.1 TaxID=3393413 RepID=UPI003CF41158
MLPSGTASDPTPAAASATRQTLLEAATAEFVAFGYRRSSMESVARRAGLSRATLYLYWSSKEQLVRSLVEALHEEHLSAMREAIERRHGDTAQQLAAVLEARFARFVALTASSPNAAELYDVHDRVCGDIAAAANARATALIEELVDALVSEGRVSLSRSGLGVTETVSVLTLCGEAAKGENRDATPTQFHDNLDRIVRMLVQGLGA